VPFVSEWEFFLLSRVTWRELCSGAFLSIIFDHWATQDDPLGLERFKSVLADEAAEAALQRTLNDEFDPHPRALDSARRVLDWMREQA